EMYTFGEQTVVIPLETENSNYAKVDARAIQDITQAIEQFTTHPVVLFPKDRYGRRFEIKCNKRDIPSILGKGGANIKMLERTFRVRLDIEKNETDPFRSDYSVLKKQMFSIRKRSLIINLPKQIRNKTIQFFTEDHIRRKAKPFFVGTTTRSGKIKLSSQSEAGLLFIEMLENNNDRIFWKAL
ncbi:MAG: hypothetical protein JSV04_07260, partial [Candidatus Heimdallarchaeota archaeon]